MTLTDPPPSSEKESRTYRSGIVAIVLDGKSQVLLGHSASYDSSWRKGYWEFPQGGVLPGESEEQALLRELKEEIGTDRVEILAKSTSHYHYDWRKEHRGQHGQEQRYFLVRLVGAPELVPDPKEFTALRWVSWESLRKMLRTFKAKREAYLSALVEFEEEGGHLKPEFQAELKN